MFLRIRPLQTVVCASSVRFFHVSSCVRASIGAWSGTNPKQLAEAQSLIRHTRNIGIVAHIDAGKTTTTERMLYYAGVTRRVGDVDSGTTTTDFMKEERERGITIQSAAVSLRWRAGSTATETPTTTTTTAGTVTSTRGTAGAGKKEAAAAGAGEEFAINLIDTPGHVDFTVEVERAMRVVDGVVALFDASAGVQAQSYTVLKQSRKFDIPMLAFLNKMDKYNADFDMSVRSLREKLQVEPLLLQLPLRAQDGDFEGVIDLVGQRTLRFGGTNGADVSIHDLTAADSAEHAHVMETARKGRQNLVDTLCGYDDGLSEAFIDALDKADGDEAVAAGLLPASALKAAVRRLINRSHHRRTVTNANNADNHLPVVPVLCGASRRDQGVQPLLDAVCDYLPSPKDRQLTGLARNGLPVPLPPASAIPTVPTIALAFKVTHTTGPKGSRAPLVFLRVYSGTVTPRKVLANNTRNGSETVTALYVMHADEPVEVPYLTAGQIGAAFLTKTYTGDTLYAPPVQLAKKGSRASDGNATEEATEEVFSLEGIDAPPPVISFSVEAATKNHISLLESALDELTREDPSLRVSKNDFGNIVMSGMGELHLDIIMSRLAHEYQVQCRLLRAIIEYRETVTRLSAVEKLIGTHLEVPYIEASLEVRPMLRDGEVCAVADVPHFVIHPDLEAAFFPSNDRRGGGGGGGGGGDGSTASAPPTQRVNDVRNAKEELRVIRTTFSEAVVDCARLGPLAGMPMHGIEVVLTHLRKVGGSAPLQEKMLRSAARALVSTALKSIPKTSLAIVEPIMRVEVHVSEATYIGNVVSSLNEHNALSVDILDDGKSVAAVVAMRNTVRYTTELRKAVKGHANMFSSLDHYRVVEEKAVVARILKNLGITS